VASLRRINRGIKNKDVIAKNTLIKNESVLFLKIRLLIINNIKEIGIIPIEIYTKIIPPYPKSSANTERIVKKTTKPTKMDKIKIPKKNFTLLIILLITLYLL
jgi:hypothetical protein